jgi:hypothetical protein
MKNTRLFWQIFLPALLIIATSIFATTWIGTRMIQSFYYEQMQGDIKDRALLLKPHILQLLAAGDADLQEFCRQNGRVADTRITVIAGTGGCWLIPVRARPAWIITAVDRRSSLPCRGAPVHPCAGAKPWPKICCTWRFPWKVTGRRPVY